VIAQQLTLKDNPLLKAKANRRSLRVGEVLYQFQTRDNIGDVDHRP
jgi:hypothetical protein